MPIGRGTVLVQAQPRGQERVANPFVVGRFLEPTGHQVHRPRGFAREKKRGQRLAALTGGGRALPTLDPLLTIRRGPVAQQPREIADGVQAEVPLVGFGHGRGGEKSERPRAVTAHPRDEAGQDIGRVVQFRRRTQRVARFFGVGPGEE